MPLASFDPDGRQAGPGAEDFAGGQCTYMSVPLIETEAELDRLLSTPAPSLVSALSAWQGDLLVLGAGGKIGPGLALLARKALTAAGSPANVTAAGRFRNTAVRRRRKLRHELGDELEGVSVDLLHAGQVALADDRDDEVVTARRVRVQSWGLLVVSDDRLATVWLLHGCMLLLMVILLLLPLKIGEVVENYLREKHREKRYL